MNKLFLSLPSLLTIGAVLLGLLFVIALWGIFDQRKNAKFVAGECERLLQSLRFLDGRIKSLSAEIIGSFYPLSEKSLADFEKSKATRDMVSRLVEDLCKELKQASRREASILAERLLEPIELVADPLNSVWGSTPREAKPERKPARLWVEEAVEIVSSIDSELAPKRNRAVGEFPVN